MLAHLRTAAPHRSATPWSILGHGRGFASRRPTVSEEKDDDADGDDDKSFRDSGDETIPRDPPFDKWLDTIGKLYRDPVRPRNWIGGKVPFPLNPSFKPPTPISDRLRTQIYNEYMTNPKLYSVRVLSERHGVSIQRVDAILRLKGLEENWQKNKQLQTGFQAGMEEILGVADNIKTVRGASQGLQELGEDATEADAVSSAEKNRLRDRYTRMFWEPIVEGQEPVILRVLERAREQDRSRARAELLRRDAHARVPRPKEEVHAVVERPDRPTIKFVDVGGKFIDLDDRVARLKAADHRASVKAKRRARASQSTARPEAAVAAH